MSLDVLAASAVGSGLGVAVALLVLGRWELRQQRRLTAAATAAEARAVATARAEAIEALKAPSLHRDLLRCDGRPGCVNRPVTVRSFSDGGSQRLCEPCRDDSALIPVEKQRALTSSGGIGRSP